MTDAPDRPILPWRLITGAWLHFIVPAYLVVLLLAFLLGTASWSEPGSAARFAVSVSIRFVAAYGAMMIASALGAWLLDPVLRRRRDARAARDPHAGCRRSERDVRAALEQAKAFSTGERGSRMTSALSSAAGTTWDHADPRYQRLSADLAEAMRVFAIALASAMPEGRQSVIEMACESLERIIRAVGELGDEQGRLDEGDARAMAGYIGVRYGDQLTLDLTGRPRDGGVN